MLDVPVRHMLKYKSKGNTIRHNLQKTMTKKKLLKIAEHIAKYENCECEHCLSQEQGTYLDGLMFAIRN